MPIINRFGIFTNTRQYPYSYHKRQNLQGNIRNTFNVYKVYIYFKLAEINTF